MLARERRRSTQKKCWNCESAEHLHLLLTVSGGTYEIKSHARLASPAAASTDPADLHNCACCYARDADVCSAPAREIGLANRIYELLWRELLLGKRIARAEC